jgi:hypothetical protein
MTLPLWTAGPEEKDADITKMQGYNTIRKNSVRKKRETV